jgi:hypothetical protein
MKADWPEMTRRPTRVVRPARAEAPMTEIDDASTQFVEAEIKEHHAALIRQMVVIGIVICLLLIWVGLHH